MPKRGDDVCPKCLFGATRNDLRSHVCGAGDEVIASLFQKVEMLVAVHREYPPTLPAAATLLKAADEWIAQTAPLLKGGNHAAARASEDTAKRLIQGLLGQQLADSEVSALSSQRAISIRTLLPKADALRGARMLQEAINPLVGMGRNPTAAIKAWCDGALDVGRHEHLLYAFLRSNGTMKGALKLKVLRNPKTRDAVGIQVLLLAGRYPGPTALVDRVKAMAVEVAGPKAFVCLNSVTPFGTKESADVLFIDLNEPARKNTVVDLKPKLKTFAPNVSSFAMLEPEEWPSVIVVRVKGEHDEQVLQRIGKALSEQNNVKRVETLSQRNVRALNFYDSCKIKPATAARIVDLGIATGINMTTIEEFREKLDVEAEENTELQLWTAYGVA